SDVWEAIAKEGSSYDVYRFYLARGLQRLVERPIEFLGVVLVKVAASLGVSPLPDTGPSPTFVLERAGGALALGRWSFALFLGLGIAGWLAAPRGPIRRGVSLGLLAVAATSILGTTSAAARQPGVLLLAMASGGFLASLAGTLEGGRARSALPLIALPVALGLSFVLGQLSPTAALLNPSEDYRLAGILAISASPREAIPLLERSVRTNPQNAEAHASLARAYQREGLTENAMREFRAAFDADSTNATVLLGLASVEQEQQNAGRALDLVSRLVNQHPNNPLYLNEAARMFIQSGRWDIAKPLLLRALEIKPDYRTAQTNLEAVTQAELEAERSLIPDEMRLPADDPLNTTLGQIGRALQQGDSAMADSLITEIEQQRPDHVLPHWMRAAWLARTGDLGGATRALETCNRLAPCRPAIAGQLAQIYVQLGREADAKRLLDGCIATPPSPEMGRRLEQVRTELLGS
ncbi:MAG: tetratricopeptide repeat protein, partial [Candidatus Eisenbacteria bacterium]|nr:tetratricopeptide repeat protein [Candidatus Eisenbacteria bacterium]